ncbi:MAG: hypothetical protein H0X69_03970 [Gemmatimonadales bacterium]|nr:hypothetical protein [Gemmatimonadales bacterium]
MTSRKTLTSIVILLAIGLHAAPLLLRSERGTLWPFMQWSMYKNSRPPGPIEASQRRIIAVTASGRKDTVTTHLLGLSITVLEQRFLRPLATGDSSAAPLLLERLNRTREDSVVELRLEHETYTITDSGIVRTDNPVLTYRAGRGEPR